jgi:arginyl-tRNA--protein-N-Asp/Glu arginylyltransferase
MTARELRIDDVFLSPHVAAGRMDELWAAGWRHQGILFFRYSHWPTEGVEHEIMPVRLNLAQFTPSKSQRRVWRRNADLRWEIGPARLDEVLHRIFALHSSRFHENVPQSLTDFLGGEPATVPCKCRMLKAMLGDRVIAASFLDQGEHDVSSSYAIFDPAHAKRGLGTLTLLKEIETAKAAGRRYLYHGYATRTPSHYDYKKTFNALESYDWAKQAWSPHERYIMLPPGKQEPLQQSASDATSE